MPFFIRLAWAYFCSHHSHIRVLKVVGRAATIGLSLSLTILIVTLSVMNGFERQVRQKIFDQMPHVVAFHTHGLTPPENLGVVRIEHAYQTKLFLPRMGYQQVNAIITDRVDRRQMTAPIYNRLFLQSEKEQVAFIGILRTPSYQSMPFSTLMFNDFTPTHTAPLSVLFPLSDLSRFANIELTKTQGFWLENPFAVDQFVSEMKNIFGSDVDFMTWKDQHKTFFDALKGEKRLISLVLSFLILLIYGQFALTLILLFQDKRQDFVTLQACTAKRDRLLYRTFFAYGCLNIIVGLIVGLGGGCLLSLWLPNIVKYLENVFSFQFLPYQHYHTDTLPSELLFSDVLITGLFTCAVGVVTCHVLARYANRTRLIDLLRNA
ncbi:MAG: ABC transporter permease [Gammaproteobacteria bacterium]|nr:ABC transporter permease [Gammaproteobacteria bacterium]